MIAFLIYSCSMSADLGSTGQTSCFSTSPVCDHGMGGHCYGKFPPWCAGWKLPWPTFACLCPLIQAWHRPSTTRDYASLQPFLPFGMYCTYCHWAFIFPPTESQAHSHTGDLHCLFTYKHLSQNFLNFLPAAHQVPWWNTPLILWTWCVFVPHTGWPACTAPPFLGLEGSSQEQQSLLRNKHCKNTEHIWTGSWPGPGKNPYWQTLLTALSATICWMSAVIYLYQILADYVCPWRSV